MTDEEKSKIFAIGGSIMRIAREAARYECDSNDRSDKKV